MNRELLPELVLENISLNCHMLPCQIYQKDFLQLWWFPKSEVGSALTALPTIPPLRVVDSVVNRGA